MGNQTIASSLERNVTWAAPDHPDRLVSLTVNMHEKLDTALEESRLGEQALMHELRKGTDNKVGVAAFTEKRAPKFTGQ